MVRKKRGFEYQQSLARKWGWDSYYEWRKAGYPHHPPTEKLSPKSRWRHKQFDTREKLLTAIHRMPKRRVIRVDVFVCGYGNFEDPRWINVFAKGTTEEFIRRIDDNIISIPEGCFDIDEMQTPYSLRWRIGR